MAEVVDALLAEHTLLHVQEEVIVPETRQDHPQLLRMLIDGLGRDQDVIEVNEDIRQIAQDLPHQLLEQRWRVLGPEGQHRVE